MKRLLKLSYDEFEENEEEEKSKYKIIGYTIYKIERTDNPEEAIRLWSQIVTQDPLNTAIVAKSADSAELLDWAKSNKDRIAEIFEETGADKIYKTDKMLSSLDNAIPCSSSFDKYDGDQIYPFCIG